MTLYCIVETEDGHTIAQRREKESAVAAAERLGGTVVDPGPYASYEEAQEALIALEQELDDETSDVAADRPLEERYEMDDR